MSSLFLTSLLSVIFLLVFCVVFLLVRYNTLVEHVAALDKTLKGALESQAMIVGLIQKASAKHRAANRSVAGKRK